MHRAVWCVWASAHTRVCSCAFGLTRYRTPPCASLVDLEEVPDPKSSLSTRHVRRPLRARRAGWVGGAHAEQWQCVCA